MIDFVRDGHYCFKHHSRCILFIILFSQMSSSYVQGGQSGVIPLTRVPMQYNFLKDDIWNRSMISKETYERVDIQTKHIAGKVNVETKRGAGGKPETLVRELFDSTSSPHPEFKELMIQWN